MNQPLSHPNTSLLHQIPTSVALLDNSFNFTGASLLWLKKFNLTEKEILGKSIFKIFPTLSENWSTKLQYALDGLCDIQIVDTTQSEFDKNPDFIWSLNPWIDDSGKTCGVTLSIKDVTELSKLKIELQKAKIKLQEKSSIAKIGSWEYIVESDEIKLSPVAKQLFKIPKKKALNYNYNLKLYKAGTSRANIKKRIKEALKFGIPWNENLQMISVDNKELWVNTIGRPKFTNGRCTRIIGTIQDITEKMIVDQRYLKQGIDSKQDIFFQKSPTAMITIDFSTGRINSANKAFSSLIGLSDKNFLNKTYRYFKVLPNNKHLSTIIQQLNKKGSFTPYDFDFKTKKSTSLKLRLEGKLISTSLSKKTIICSITNITNVYHKNKNIEQQLKETKDHLGKIVNFAHMVSHNLKAHTTNFNLLFDFLRIESNEKERRKLLSILGRGNSELSDTILGLREIVAIQENNVLEKEHLNLNESIYQAKQSLSGSIRKYKVKLINEIPETLKIKSIKPYLDNVISNVLSNAIKFKKERKNPLIIITAEVEKEYTVISIEDNGVGIDLAKNEKKLFKLYATLGNNLESRGMGLYLANYQMKLMNGKIEVSSELGEGSTFKLYFSNNP